ncbi:ABC transporter substrate-binding protein [Paraburkholderia sp.]|uniref:ABC transporter substrate-binding protein n=1 Tax=Paraburkholderia sp. TaxID=1926495 RepID=UPI0039E54B1B
MNLFQFFSRLAGATALTIALSALPATPVFAQSRTVVFAGWGGSIEKAQRQVFFDSFEKETGIKVIDVPDVQLAKLKAMVDTGNPQWDVVQALGMWIPQGEKENLWEKLDFNVISKQGVPPSLVDDYSLGNSTYGMVLAYNTKAVKGNVPESWRSLWDIKGHPGARGMFDGPRYTLEVALLADGVPPSKLYPLDVDRAFRSLDRIKDQVAVWWKQWPQVPVLLASQELTMSLTSNTRINSVRKAEGAPVDLSWHQSLMTVDFLAVPRNAKNRDNAMKLIQWMNDPRRQAQLARMTGIGPGNADALKYLTDDEKADLASYHYQKGEMVLFDNAWWAANEQAMTQRWDQWKLQ